jgi:hypothetical protein
MNKRLLKAILKIATSDSSVQPHNKPVYPDELMEAGIPGDTLSEELKQLESNGLIRFMHSESNIISLTRSGVMIAEVV